MQYLFNVGFLYGKDSKKDVKKIHFLPVKPDVTEMFNYSISKMCRSTNDYDIETLIESEKQQIYFIYNKHLDFEEVKKDILDIIDGQVTKIIDPNPIYIAEDINGGPTASFNAIYWDVINGIIIIIGQDSLKSVISKIDEIASHYYEQENDWDSSHQEHSKLYQFVANQNMKS